MIETRITAQFDGDSAVTVITVNTALTVGEIKKILSHDSLSFASQEQVEEDLAKDGFGSTDFINVRLIEDDGRIGRVQSVTREDKLKLDWTDYDDQSIMTPGAKIFVTK